VPSRPLSDLAVAEVRRRPWIVLARPEQRAPRGEWRCWFYLGGRGTGKTRSGAEWVLDRVEQGSRRVALVGPTAADVRDVMVEGESGILACAPADDRPLYEPSKRRLTWPNGAIGALYSADEPERLRGPQHDTAWADELAAWRYPEAWDQLLFGLRLGDPRVVVTTTPKPSRLVKELLAQPTTVVTRGATFDNADNLAPAFLERIAARYVGTRLGRQELHAELLEDVPGALWTREMLERAVQECPASLPDMERVVVALDPPATSDEGADEAGLVVVGRGLDGRGYLLDDLSARMSPNEWAVAAVRAFDRYQADRIVGEINMGGEMIEALVRTVRPEIPFSAVRATRGKMRRAEPIAALYEQGRVSHVRVFPELEDQLATWTPDVTDYSPDRLDALVWALTELALPAAFTGPFEITDEHVIDDWEPEPRLSGPVLVEHEPSRPRSLERVEFEESELYGGL